MNHESRKIRHRRHKSWILYILFFAMIGGMGFVFYPAFQKKFFFVLEKISLTRWLYWCAGGPDAEDRSCYYVNRDGILMDEAPRLRGNLFPKIYDERAPASSFIEERLLAFIRRFYDLGQFVVKSDETLEIGWPGTMHIITTLRDDPKKVAENLALILEKEIGDRRDEVDYIDLRFGNRVYYKLR